MSHNAGGAGHITVGNSPVVLTAQQLQLQLQKQAHLQQQQQQQNLKLSGQQLNAQTSSTATVVVSGHDGITLPLNSTQQFTHGGNVVNVSGFEKIANSDGTTVLIGNNTNPNAIVNVVSALQNKHRRRSTPTDINK